jgi:hypothetical protein
VKLAPHIEVITSVPIETGDVTDRDAGYLAGNLPSGLGAFVAVNIERVKDEPDDVGERVGRGEGVWASLPKELCQADLLFSPVLSCSRQWLICIGCGRGIRILLKTIMSRTTG